MNNLLKDGTYTFKIIDMENTTSKASGNPMTKLVLSITDENGNEKRIYDYLVTSNEWKLKSFYDCVPTINKRAAGELQRIDYMNREGICTIKTQDAVYEDNEIKYPAKNIVDRYLKAKEEKIPALQQEEDDFFSDSIPF